MPTLPTIGLNVVTSDGHQIGRVKEVYGDCFKVDIPMWPDHWISFDSIDEVATDEVRLSLSENSLGESVRVGVGHTGFHVHDEEDGTRSA